MEEYKRQREQRGLHNEQRRRGDARKANDRKKEDLSDADAEGESDGDWEDGGVPVKSVSPSGAAHDNPPNLKEFNRIKIGRVGFGRVCFYPGFEETARDCFIRINVGVDKATGQEEYRIAKIRKIIEGRPYAIQGPNGKNFVTNQYAVAAHGKSERDWPLIMCSEGPITEREMNRYMITCKVEGVPTPTAKGAVEKNEAIHKLLNRTWTDSELQEKLRRMGVLNRRTAPSERASIQKLRDDAIAKGDEALIAKYDAELAALDPPKLAWGTSLHKPPVAEDNKGPSQQERLAALNRANRKANNAEVRKAQLAEKRAEHLNQVKIARGEASADPFARVKTRAKIMYDVNDGLVPPSSSQTREGSVSDLSRAGTPSNIGTPGKIGTPKRAGTPLAEKIATGEKKKGGLPTIHHAPMDDDVIGALDFGIDIEI